MKKVIVLYKDFKSRELIISMQNFISHIFITRTTIKIFVISVLYNFLSGYYSSYIKLILLLLYIKHSARSLYDFIETFVTNFLIIFHQFVTKIFYHDKSKQYSSQTFILVVIIYIMIISQSFLSLSNLPIAILFVFDNLFELLTFSKFLNWSFSLFNMIILCFETLCNCQEPNKRGFIIVLILFYFS